MRRWAEWLPVAGLSALLVVETFFDLRRSMTPSPWLWNSYLIVHLLAGLACLGLALVRRRAGRFSRAGWIVIASATALMVYCLVSAAVTPRPRVSWIYVPRAYLVVPVLTAMATLLLAVALVRVLPAEPVHRVLWWPAALTLACAFAQWPRSAVVHGSPRLATGMGGSAVVHVPLLLATGVALAAFLAGWRRWWSLGLTVIGVAAVVLTGSRSGVVCLVLAGVVVGLQWLRSRRAWLVAGAVVIVAGIVVAAVPMLHRLLNPTDELRAKNLETALGVWTETPKHLLLGVGSGRLWPWYAFDSHLLRTPWRGWVGTQWGAALNSAHSTFLQVLVELGLLGMLLLIPVVVVPVVVLARRLWPGLRGASRPVPDTVPLIALVATVPAFFLDTYLLKNYGASLWWWLVLLCCLRARRRRQGAQA
ncbi:Wzy_C domain-containing protein [Acidipropionibacterium acidipropionici ATCC 4875]|uniref:Wzy_C domain-containing protein n=1 Tax=Acidipropionibacterium acidipropionici (strain ATCC 4875 / DSM 20272 / JCM 6432 / NBRC 12425 / NCIMB 8070 / 4) TaxID=1171373 RepID=K7RPS1_ACIA4|nr:O-antigen ligase family protein [Acidipropionibacterium acidipropionici]AFV88301.1 Wzy_C domain-containing protein [Acidipropionibacterium acidipropionici ATCC 4875]